MHSPDSEKRGGADAARSLAPLVMQVVVRKRGSAVFRVFYLIILVLFTNNALSNELNGTVYLGKNLAKPAS